MTRVFTSDEKDALKEEAMRAYERCYGRCEDRAQRFDVTKGIESMAGIVFAALERKGLGA